MSHRANEDPTSVFKISSALSEVSITEYLQVLAFFIVNCPKAISFIGV